MAEENLENGFKVDVKWFGYAEVRNRWSE